MSIPAEKVVTRSRVVIVEDHTLVRQSIVKILRADGLDVVGEAGRGDEAMALIARTMPTIVLLDVALPGRTGLDVAAELRASHPEIRVVFLTMHDDDATVARAIGLGADGYLLKTSSTEELLQGLRAVAAGGSFLSPGIARNVMQRAGGRLGVSALTDRELEVLRLLADGSRPAEIARALFVSLKTVRNHLASIYVKLGVDTAGQAIGEAFRRGLVAPTF